MVISAIKIIPNSFSLYIVMVTDNPETHNLDAEKGGGYDYDQSEAQLQAFSDKAVSTKKQFQSKGTPRHN